MSSTFDLEKERQNVQSSVHSSITKTASAPNLEPESHNAQIGQESSHPPNNLDYKPSDGDDAAQYPHGLKLLIIVVALGMSIFLVALDMVCSQMPKRGEERLLKVPSLLNTANVEKLNRLL